MLTKIQRSVEVLLLATIITAMATGISTAQPIQAVADIYGCSDMSIQGSAKLKERFSEEGVKVVDVTINMMGLSPGKHAVHIHETGTCEPCGAAGGHFDPGPDSNPSPDGNHPFHSGDLINLDFSRINCSRRKSKTTNGELGKRNANTPGEPREVNRK